MRLRMRYVQVVLIAFIGFLSIAAAPIPQDWRNPTEQETNQAWRNESKNHYLSVGADFNGDGIVDEAKLLVRQKGQGLALFAFVSKGKNRDTILLEELKDARWLDVMGIDIAEKGKYKTACGKGYFSCSPGEPEELTLEFPGIDYFKEGSVNSFFFWDKTIGKFKKIWISD